MNTRNFHDGPLGVDQEVRHTSGWLFVSKTRTLVVQFPAGWMCILSSVAYGVSLDGGFH